MANIFKQYCSPQSPSELQETDPYPQDFDQYESPASYEFEDDLPDDEETEELEQTREGW